MSAALANSTEKKYQCRIELWKIWCFKHKVSNFQDADIANIINYLSEIEQSKVSYSVLNLSRSAISSVHVMIDNCRIGVHPLISTFMKGAINRHPPRPRYSVTWDIASVLDVLASSHFNPDNELSFSQLQQKVVLLIMISTACRQSVIPRLSRQPSHLVDRGDHYIIHPEGWDKTSRFSKKVHPILVFKNLENPLISPYDSLQAFIAQSSHVKSDRLFVSDKVDKPLGTPEVCQWVIKVMRLANIPSQFLPHSMRSAVVSKAFQDLGASAIMEAVDWRQESTFRTFYLKNVQSFSTVEKRRSFQNSILV